MNNSKPKRLMYMGGTFFSGHLNREGTFVDMVVCKVPYMNRASYVGEAVKASIHINRKEKFDNRYYDNVSYTCDRAIFNVEYNKENAPFITVPTIYGPVIYVLGDPLPTKEEWDNTEEGKNAAAHQKRLQENRRDHEVWKLACSAIPDVVGKMFGAHPKRTRKFASGVNTYTAEEIFERVVEHIGPQYSVIANTGVTFTNRDYLHRWARRSAQKVLIEKGRKKYAKRKGAAKSS